MAFGIYTVIMKMIDNKTSHTGKLNRIQKQIERHEARAQAEADEEKTK